MKTGVFVSDYNTKYWYQEGILHRDDGPAIEYPDGEKAWYQHGQRHRVDGPAIEYASGSQSWYYHGKKIYCDSLQEFEKIIKLKAFW
jgi:hypothetical protein